MSIFPAKRLHRADINRSDSLYLILWNYHSLGGYLLNSFFGLSNPIGRVGES
ncbi:MAG: hypothetical protein JW840_07875 [Candidatus Thermoplasmatota archaeon]|nr:hypothetical protein [Candidatus Thermoplasmatota archaeon]